MTSATRLHSGDSGYSLLEMLFALGVVAPLASMAIVQINVSRPGLKGDGGMRIVLGRLTEAREGALSQRRYVQVVLDPKLQIEDTTETPTVPATVKTVLLEGGVQFALMSSLPDTPEKIGNSRPIDFGVLTKVQFSPEGTLVDPDGAFANGTVFLAVANRALSARAITVLGSTGRIRGYKWDGSKWRPVS